MKRQTGYKIWIKGWLPFDPADVDSTRAATDVICELRDSKDGPLEDVELRYMQTTRAAKEPAPAAPVATRTTGAD